MTPLMLLGRQRGENGDEIEPGYKIGKAEALNQSGEGGNK